MAARNRASSVLASSLSILAGCAQVLLAHGWTLNSDVAAPILARSGPGTSQINFNNKPYVIFTSAAKDAGNQDDLVIDLANCGTAGTQDPNGIRWSKNNVGQAATMKCQTFLLWNLPWVDANAYGVSLSDTKKWAGWDMDAGKHNNKLQPFINDFDPIWQASQQLIIECKASNANGYYGQGCTMKYVASDKCFAIDGKADLNAQNGNLIVGDCKSDRAKWDLKYSWDPFNGTNHNTWN